MNETTYPESRNLTDVQAEEVVLKLSARRESILILLRRDLGIRQIANELNISHVAVIKHCKIINIAAIDHLKSLADQRAAV